MCIRDRTGAKFEEREVPDDMKDLVKEHREKLIEEISGTDEVLMEKYLNGEETVSYTHLTLPTSDLV